MKQISYRFHIHMQQNKPLEVIKANPRSTPRS